MTVLRFVITNVPKEHEKAVIEALIPLIQKGVITASDIHMMEEEKRDF